MTDCDFWIVNAPNGDNTSKIIYGFRSDNKPSNKTAKNYSKKYGVECVLTPWYRFFNTKKEAMEFFK